MPTPKRFDVTRVDAKTDTVIEVKPVDIRGALCRDHQKCVVAKAILRQKKSTAQWVDVGNHTVLIGVSRKRAIRYLLPRMAAKQVKFFDENDGRFAPCQVLLQAPVKRKLGSRPHESIETRTKRNRRVVKNKPTR